MIQKKQFILTLFLLLVLAMPLFAQPALPGAMTSVPEKIIEVLTGTFVRSVLVILFIVAGVVYAYNKDSDKAKRNFIAVVIGIVVIGGGASIVELIWSSAGL